jgi:hypothetical protein
MLYDNGFFFLSDFRTFLTFGLKKKLNLEY